MDVKCSNCGALLAPPPFPGVSLTCRFCAKPRRTSKAGWQKIIGVLDACGRH